MLRTHFSSNLVSCRNFYRTLQLYSRKKPLRKKEHIVAELPPHLLSQLKAWPKLLQHEIEAKHEHIKELLKTCDNDWTELKQRGLATPDISYVSERFDPIDGKIITVKCGGRQTGESKGFRSGSPVMLCKQDSLKPVAECVLLFKQNKELNLKVTNVKAKLDHDTVYVMMPSIETGIMQKLVENLTVNNVKRSQGANLLKLAFKGEVMPSIHNDRPITGLSDDLNDSQKRAIAAALNKKRPFVCIQGPPGTGKTEVVAEIIKRLTEKKQKILVCAPSIVAVDNVLEKTIRRLDRLAKTTNTVDYQDKFADSTRLVDAIMEHPEYTKLTDFSEDIAYSMDKKKMAEKTRYWKLKTTILKEIYLSKQVIFCTLGNHLVQTLSNFGWRPDVVIIDEAAQCIEPLACAAIIKAQRCILVGDHAQLPAVIESVECKAKLEKSLMERLCTEFKNSNLSFMLSTQYRMNEKIMRWSSDTFYESKLIADDSVKDGKLSDISQIAEDHELNSPLLFVETGITPDSEEEKYRKSYRNFKELNFIVNYTNFLINSGVSDHSIGIITPYYSQAQAIKELLKTDVTVNTVDAFQGREKDIIIFSFVRSNPLGLIGFLNDIRRMNVAVTRAKRQFCMVGNSQMLTNRNKGLRSLYRTFQEYGKIIKIDDVILETNREPLAKSL